MTKTNRVVVELLDGMVANVASDEVVELYILDHNADPEYSTKPSSEQEFKPLVGRKNVDEALTRWDADHKEGDTTGKKSVWFWCIHCERAFQSEVPNDWKRGWFIEEVGVERTDPRGHVYYECPYDGCEGSPIDFIPWDDMREDCPNFPETPEKDKVYPPAYAVE